MDTTTLVDTYLDAYGEPDRARGVGGLFGPLPDTA
jgi:hypothetical protein